MCIVARIKFALENPVSVRFENPESERAYTCENWDTASNFGRCVALRSKRRVNGPVVRLQTVIEYEPAAYPGDGHYAKNVVGDVIDAHYHELMLIAEDVATVLADGYELFVAYSSVEGFRAFIGRFYDCEAVALPVDRAEDAYILRTEGLPPGLYRRFGVGFIRVAHNGVATFKPDVHLTRYGRLLVEAIERQLG